MRKMNNITTLEERDWQQLIWMTCSYINLIEQNLDLESMKVCLDGFLAWGQHNCPRHIDALSSIKYVIEEYTNWCYARGNPQQIMSQNNIIDILKNEQMEEEC